MKTVHLSEFFRKRHNAVLCKIVALILIIVSSLFATSCLSFFSILWFGDSGIISTTDIDDYAEHAGRLASFPEQIPENAEVVSFSYNNYWLQDAFLELRFGSVKEIDEYLSSIIETIDERVIPSKLPPTGEWFYSTNNPYDENYTDLICWAYDLHSPGYYASFDGWFSSNFIVISYSYEDLSVIHSYICGSYHHDDLADMPKYFTRFGVSLEGGIQRYYYTSINENSAVVAHSFDIKDYSSKIEEFDLELSFEAVEDWDKLIEDVAELFIETYGEPTYEDLRLESQYLYSSEYPHYHLYGINSSSDSDISVPHIIVRADGKIVALWKS